MACWLDILKEKRAVIDIISMKRRLQEPYKRRIAKKAELVGLVLHPVVIPLVF